VSVVVFVLFAADKDEVTAGYVAASAAEQMQQ
jgi:hypothetical protein